MNMTDAARAAKDHIRRTMPAALDIGLEEIERAGEVLVVSVGFRAPGKDRQQQQVCVRDGQVIE